MGIAHHMASARAPRLPAKPTAVGQRTAPPPHARRTGTQRLLTTSSPHSHALPPRASPPRLALGAVCVKENVPGTGVRTISWTCESMRGDHPCMARSSKQGPWRFSKNAADLVLEPRGSSASSAPRRSNAGRTTWPSPPKGASASGRRPKAIHRKASRRWGRRVCSRQGIWGIRNGCS